MKPGIVHRLKRLMVIALVTVVSFFLLLGCTLYFAQDQLIYYKRSYKAGEAVETDTLHRLEYETSQGAQVAYYISPSGGGESANQGTPPERLWVLTAGNGSLALDWLDYLLPPSPDRADTCGFLLVDYPGYGECQGKPDPETIRENVGAALAALVQDKAWGSVESLQPRLGFFGHSIGAAVALQGAVDHGAREIVLISPFTRMSDVVAHVMNPSVKPLLRHRFDNVKNLAILDKREDRVPVTIFHGSEDKLVPVTMGKELAEKFPDLVTFHEIPEADHNYIVMMISHEIQGRFYGVEGP